MGDPYYLSLAQIADLDDYQVRQLCRRDTPGEDAADSGPSLSYWQVFRLTWEGRGMTLPEIVKKFRAEFPGEPIDEELPEELLNGDGEPTSDTRRRRKPRRDARREGGRGTIPLA